MHNRPLETLLHPHHVSLLRPGSSTLQTLYHGLDDRFTPANFALDHGQTHRNLGVPRFDIYETASAYILQGEMPGVRELADVAVEWLQGKVLLVHGAVPAEDEDVRVDDEEELESEGVPEMADMPSTREFRKMGSGLCHAPKHLKSAVSPDGRRVPQPRNENGTDYQLPILCERQVGQFQRSFTFPVGVNPDDMTTTLEHGLLRIWLPKRIAFNK